MRIDRVLCPRRLKTQLFHIRHVSHDASALRNIALVAHIDSGKTTLTESILYKSGYLSSFGTVDTGSTAERERGITIQSASIPVQWQKWSLNLIDTPGHADFGMEVESASRVVDGAVVLIDSVEGVEAQTKGVWNQLNRYGVNSRILFANKLDRTGADLHSSILSILRAGLHPRPILVALPLASFNPDVYVKAEPGLEGIVDLVKWELSTWDAQGTRNVQQLPNSVEGWEKQDVFPKDHPILPHLLNARQNSLDSLGMVQDGLLDALLEDETGMYLGIEAKQIMPYLRAATVSGEVLPVLCGSAFQHKGTETVLDYVGELLASPVDVAETKLVDSSPLHAFIWKVGWDERKGWMSFVRIYSGTLKKTSSLLNLTRGEKEKPSHLLLLYADEPKEVSELSFGSVGVILGLRHSRPGDTLVVSNASINTHPTSLVMTPPPSVMSSSILPNSHADFQGVMDALESLTRTDPSVRVDEQEGQILMHGLGALHLEIVEGRLRDEFKARFEVSRRRVSYRETFVDVGARSITVSIGLTIRPLNHMEGEIGDPRWDGNLVVDRDGNPLPPPDSSKDSKELYIGRGIASGLSASPHSSLAILPRGPNPALLAGAAASIIRKGLRELSMGPLMEPFVNMRIIVPEETLGNIMKDLQEREAEVKELGSSSSSSGSTGYPTDGIYIPPALLTPSALTVSSFDHDRSSQRRQVVTVQAPLNRMLDYNQRLRALSGGHGTFEMSNAGFKEVSDIRKLEILREIGRA
ncbi:translation elongation factor 2 [Flagelloscypha sp. PMI_526]|nr:translation elongation factor 2 [Flagelloscypha sp. PMI_526]